MNDLQNDKPPSSWKNILKYSSILVTIFGAGFAWRDLSAKIEILLNNQNNYVRLIQTKIRTMEEAIEKEQIKTIHLDRNQAMLTVKVEQLEKQNEDK